MPKKSITKIHLKIRYLKFYWNFPGANELKLIIDTVMVQRNLLGSMFLSKYRKPNCLTKNLSLSFLQEFMVICVILTLSPLG